MRSPNDTRQGRSKKPKPDPRLALFKDFFVITISDDAMQGAGLYERTGYVCFRKAVAQVGDIVVAKTPAGTFARYYQPQPDGTVILQSTKYPALCYRATQIEVMGVLYVEPEVTRTAKQPELSERARKLAALRERLAEFDDDDITNSTARFRLEKQIYDLEREQAADEWPDTINA